MDALNPTYRRIRGGSFPRVCGNYNRKVIFIRSECFDSRSYSHEYFHAVQDHLSAVQFWEIPRWLIEGSATYVANTYWAIRSDSVTITEQLDGYLTGALTTVGRDAPSLSSPGGRAIHQWGFLAVHWLVQRSDEHSIIRFFELLGESNWEDAFDVAFGMTIDDFYEAFERYRTKVLPLFPHMTDDSDEPVLEFVGDFAVATRMAVADEFASLQRFYREQLRVGTADYTMFVAADTASAKVVHESVFRSESDQYCHKSYQGGVVGIVNLSCGEAIRAYELPYPHFVSVRRHVAPRSSMPLGPDGERTRGPRWLDGVAGLHLGYRYLDEAGHEAYESFRSAELSRARGIARPLSSMATFSGFYRQAHQEARAVAVLAIEWLTDRVGDAAIFEYYRQLTESDTWEDAFETAFGIAIDDFYSEFEAYRASVVRPLPHMADDADAPVLVLVGDLPAATRDSLRADFDAVQAFFRDRLGAPPGDYTLYVGADARSLDDLHRRTFAGESYPSPSCSVSAPGFVILISLRCKHDLAEWHGRSVVRNLTAENLPYPPAGYSWRGAMWLREGSVAYAAALYRAETGSEELQRIRSGQVNLAARTRQPLSNMATIDGFSDGLPEAQGLGFLAVEWLAERAGATAIFDYYRQLPGSKSWEEAFEAAYDMTIDEFYEEFEAYRAEVAPPIEGADLS